MNDNEKGIQALQEERFEEAIQSFMQAIEKQPENPVGYINLGNVFAAVNDIEKAEQFFQQAIVLDDKAATAYYSLANLYYNTERFDEAARLYEQSIQLEMDGADAYYMLAKSFEHLGKLQLALPYSLRASELAEDDVQIQLTYGIHLAQLELFNEALVQFKKVLQLDDEQADAHYNLGLVYAVSTNEKEKAIDHLERAFTIEPNHIQAREIHTMITSALNQ